MNLFLTKNALLPFLLSIIFFLVHFSNIFAHSNRYCSFGFSLETKNKSGTIDWTDVSVYNKSILFFMSDADGDGVDDATDPSPNDPCVPVQPAGYTGYNSSNVIWGAADCDGDQVLNSTEVVLGFDPYNPDSDADGVSDLDEVSACVSSGTNNANMYGNSHVHEGGEATFFGIPSMEGVSTTHRSVPFGIYSFSSGAAWINASAAGHIDGYVRKYGITPFTFPIGNGGKYRPAAFSGFSTSGQYVTAAYYASTPVMITSRSTNIRLVSDKEYWDIDGSTPTFVTLTWDASSDVSLLSAGNLNNLTIVGWNGSQWIEVPSTRNTNQLDLTSACRGFTTNPSDLLSGAITTDIAITPSSFQFYTLGGLYNAPVANNDVYIGFEDTPLAFNPLTNDTDVDGDINPGTLDLDPATPGIQMTYSFPGQGTFSVTNSTTGQMVFVPEMNFSGVVSTLSYSVCDLSNLCSQAGIMVNIKPDTIAKLKLRVMLQGALLGTNDTLMRDELRLGGYVPLSEPYTSYSNSRFQHFGGGGGEVTTNAILSANAGTPNAIVDWVFVELRNATDSTIVVDTRSALVQRDGDVVSSSDGFSMLKFPGKVGQSYFVSIKHRNHLGVMTQRTKQLNNDSTIVNFVNAAYSDLYDKPGLVNYNGSEMVSISNQKALWGGNANLDNKVKYQGTSSDNNVILTQVLSHPGNTTLAYNYNNVLGYFNSDINLDGKVKYQGSSNDVNYIFSNVVGGYNALNPSGLYNYNLFFEQIP